MILTEDDLPIFAAGVNLTGDAITGALYYLQSIVEGDAGAGRPIELIQRMETGDVQPGPQSFYLQHFPIVIDEITHPIELKVRSGGNVQDAFRRPLPVGQWVILANDDYVLDIDNRVFLDYTSIGLLNAGWSGYSSYGFDTTYRSVRPGFSTYQATYWAGFDFSLDTTEVNKLKSAAGAILAYLTQSGAFKGVQELDVPFDEFRIKYNTNSLLVGRIPEDMMLPFKALRRKGG